MRELYGQDFDDFIMKRVYTYLNFLLNVIPWVSIVYVLGVALYLGGRAFVADQFIVPTWSMAPTLQPGDRVVVNKLLMGARLYTDFDFKEDGQELKSIRMKGLRRLKHNDIVVFNYPQVGDRIAFKINYVYCKRCVALPGDSLSIVNGHYRCNNHEGVLGLESEQKYLETMPEETYETVGLSARLYDGHLGWTVKQMGPMYIPRKDDITVLGAKEGALYRSLLEYETGKTATVDWESDRVLLDDVPTERHTWQHDYYFMAGDNVLNSIDSRYWGLVPEEYIVGVVKLISYAKDKETDKIKWERTLKRL